MILRLHHRMHHIWEVIKLFSIEMVKALIIRAFSSHWKLDPFVV